jgi:hypothetical protein
MTKRMVGTIVSGVVFGVVLLGASGVGWGQEAKALYPAMAPIEQYRVASVAEEVALARSAANASVSGDAEVMVLGSHGYETAAKGTNGFMALSAWLSARGLPPSTTLSSGTRSCVHRTASMRLRHGR